VIPPVASRRAANLSGAEEGFTLTEMIVVLAILGVVIGGLTALFVSGIKSETDQTARAQAQFDARTALDQLRREVHCATAVNPNPNGTWPTNAITITLGKWCSTNTTGAPPTNNEYVTWCTSGSGPYKLRRIDHRLADTSAANYINACPTTPVSPATARLWASDIVDYGSVSGGRIFNQASSQLPSLPAMAEPDLTYGSGTGSFSTGVTYGYIVDPIVSGVEQPGTENLITPQEANHTVLVDWTQACNAYPQAASVTAFRIYGRTAGGEQLLQTIATTGTCQVAATAAGALCQAVAGLPKCTDMGSGTPSGTPPGATRTQLSVTIPVRADNSTVRLISLPDALTLRNTPR
jgi:prepilin-type N-terminal cleavage/methylation domain-containing protein